MSHTSDQSFYDQVAELLPNPQLMFLNYGYSDTSSESCSWIAPSDQDHKYHLNLAKHVLSGVELSRATVLEVGSGRGGNCYYLSRYTGTERIYGVDRCEANVRFCRAVHHLPKVTFLIGDAEQLPFAGETFDVVLNLESSHCYPHFERFLAEVHRVLRPQGTFCYADLWFLDFLEFDWKQRKQALEESPLQLVSEEDISEPVFLALKNQEGFIEKIHAMADKSNSQFVEEVVERLKVIRLMLAAGRCSYMAWKFRKP